MPSRAAARPHVPQRARVAACGGEHGRRTDGACTVAACGGVLLLAAARGGMRGLVAVPSDSDCRHAQPRQDLTLSAAGSLYLNASYPLLNARPLISAWYLPANAGQWGGAPPTNLQDAMDRLTNDVYMMSGMMPIP
jgi:hypothetical protein